MHMADTLISPAVGAAMCVVSTASIAFSVAKAKKDELCEKKIPMMGAMGAFVFAAQMLNFAIPATGSSGHFVGGILLAAMIGSSPALLSISAILVIQSLFFADGGLLALGCNIFNMGVVPCLIVYPLVFKPLVKKGMTHGRITAASVFAAIIALQIGALCVALETLASGIAELPFSSFALLMLPIHLAIGVAEGAATATILCIAFEKRAMPVKAFAAAALLVAGVLSMFASSNPDGLEWAIEKTAGMEFINEVNEEPIKTAFMPYYNFKGAEGGSLGTAVAGVSGVALTFLLAASAAFAVFAAKRRSLSPA